MQLRTVKSPKYGFLVSHRPDDSFVGRHAEYDGIEPAPSSIYYNYLKPSDVVVDAGANIGFYSLLAAKKRAKVLAFEPEPLSFEILQTNIKQNKYTKQVTAHHMALGHRTGPVKVFQSMVNYGDHRVEQGIINQVEVGSVEMTTIDSLDAPITVVKLDTQGYEWNIWQGMQETVRRGFSRGRFFVLTEFNLTPDKFDYFNALKETFGVVRIIVDMNKRTAVVESVEQIERILKSWGHDHANLVLVKED